LISLLNWANKDKGNLYGGVKLLVKTLSCIATTEEISTLMEDSIKLVDIARGREEKEKWEFE
jgi:hypothetical protein